MRLSFGPIPRSREFDAEEAGWRALAEPEPGRFAVQALLLATPLLVAAFIVLTKSVALLKSEPGALAILLAFFVVMVPLHELLHALSYPGGLRSEHLVVGAWPRRGLLYVLYDAPLPRRRLLIMLAAPFVLFSAALGGAVAVATPEWRLIFVQLLLVHTASCTGDFLTFTRIATQVPSGSLIHNSGWKTFWNLERESMAA